MTYQIIITEETAANIIIDNNTTNVSITTNEYPITIQYNAVIEQAGGNAYGNANVAAFLASSSLNGNIITSANISGAYILGNGSQLTGLPATYGNANVAANLAAFGSNPISTTGNITAGYFAGNGSLLTNIIAGNITGTVANATYALNANASTYSTNAIQANVANVANSVAGANVTGTVANATYALNSNAATFAGTVTTAAQPNITSVGILTAINTRGNISATGNITGNYFLGNGSQLTGLPATYGNANVAANLAAFANNPISTSGNITSGNLNVGIDAVITGNLTVNGTTTTVNSNTVTINDKFINVANNASTASLANGGGLGVGPVGTEYATLTYNSAGNIWTTNIGLSVAGNITGNVFTGNGAGLTDINAGNIVGAYGNANVANFLGNGFGSNTIVTTGNITTGNLLTGGQVSATGNVTGGNIRSAVFQAVNSAGGVLRNASGSSQLQWGGGGGDNLTLDVSTNITGANAQINISPTGNSGHVHIKPTGTPSIEIAPTYTGSINNMIIGNITPAAVSATTVSASGNIDGGNLRTGGLITATGNINGANLVATANLTSTQQTIVGTANVGTTGNIVMSGRNIATDMKFSPDGATGTAAYTGRVMIGTGWFGNNAVGQPSRLAVSDVIERTNTGTNVKHFDVDSLVSLAANVTNSSFRQHGIGTIVRVGGGSAANTYSGSTGAGVINAFAGIQPQVNIGNASPYFLGNTTISHASINGGFITVNAGSQVGNAYGMIPGLISSGSPTPNITNYIGFASALGAAPIVTGNAYAYYHPGTNGSAEATATGLVVGNQVRAATNYYAFRNDDDVAQVKLGSLRFYNEYQATPANTTGTVNIDKSLGQVQLFTPTGNVTIGDFQNFVFNASNSVSNIAQTDTMTVIITQGATPYTVTMPTGNASIKYAGGVSTIGTTANAATMISITGTKVGNAATAGTGLYLVTVSSEFS